MSETLEGSSSSASGSELSDQETLSVGSVETGPMAPRSDIGQRYPGSPGLRANTPGLAAASPIPESRSNVEDEDYFGPLRRLGACPSNASTCVDSLERTDPSRTEAERAVVDGVRSFSVLDILNHRSSRRKCAQPTRIVRPWDPQPQPSGDLEESRIKSDSSPGAIGGVSGSISSRHERRRGSNNPLDELFKMTNKTLQEFKEEKQGELESMFFEKKIYNIFHVLKFNFKNIFILTSCLQIYQYLLHFSNIVTHSEKTDC